MTADQPKYSDALLQCWASLGIPSQLAADRSLPVFAEPALLEIAETGSDGREHRLIPAAAAAWSDMKSAARAAAIDLFIVSAHRSIARQVEIIERKLSDGQTPEQIFSVNAPPGCSEHHSGRAIDIGTTDSPLLEIEFEQTPAWSWLAENAARFGFTLTYPRDNSWGYTYEPWHWCYSPSPGAHRDHD